MKLPSFKLLKRTDFEDQYQKLVDTLSLSLNNGIEVLYDNLSHRVSLRDNIACTVKDISVEVDASGLPKAQTIIKTDLSTKVEGAQVIMATNRTIAGNYVATTGGPFISFEIITGGINIKHIAGLVPNNKYDLRVVIYQQ